MPTVAQGRLFHFDRHGGVARLTCFDSATGEEIWRSEYVASYEDSYDFSNGPRASPLVHDGRVYTFGAEGRLRCHRSLDGKLLWEVDTAARFGVVQNFFGVGSSPVIEGNLLIAQIGGSPRDSPSILSGELKGNGSGLVAFNRLTGKVIYQISNELASYSSPRLATISGRRWGLVLTRGGLLGFEPSRGQVDFFFPWRARRLETVNAATPVIVDDTVLISEGYEVGSALLRIRPGGYEVVWQDSSGRAQTLQSHWSTPVYHQGYFYASSGKSSGSAELRCIEHLTGRVVWSQPGLGRSTLLYVDGHLLVLGEYGELRLIRATPERYDLAAKVNLSKKKVLQSGGGEMPLLAFPVWNAPILAHGRVYLLGKNTLVSLELIPGAD